MKKIIPYKTAAGACAALDNGGRFYNLLTQANDGTISAVELAKTAGLFNDKQKMVLYLRMSIAELGRQEITEIENSLSDDLKSAYHRYCPQHLLSAEAETKGIPAANAILTGVPKFIEGRTDFNGFIMIPIMTGKTMIMTMVPIIDHYDVYEIRDRDGSEKFILAHARSSVKLPEQMIRCGGVIKELQSDKKGLGKTGKFLESCYYTPVS